MTSVVKTSSRNKRRGPIKLDLPGTVDNLAGLIRSAIVQGEFSPNERLVEGDLVVRYETSRGAVRTALTALESEGLVEREANRGARVRAISREEAIEFCEVRTMLESLSAAKAAERMTIPDERQLTKFVERMEAAVGGGDLVAYSQLNESFHHRIREISGHSTASTILERLQNQSVRHQFRLTLVPGRPLESLPEHREMLDALIARDRARAEAATRAHLLSALETLVSMRDTEIRSVH